MVNHFVFVDAAGNFGFDFNKDDVSKYFVVTALIVKYDDKEHVQKEIEKVRHQYFKGKEMKLNRIHSPSMQHSIIQSITHLNFTIYAIVVNKTKLFRYGGLAHKNSFFKYVHGLLYHYLFETLHDVGVIADRFGDEEFMLEFKKYINERHMPNLFNDSAFFFDDRKENVFLQLANIVGDAIFNRFEDDGKEHDLHVRSLSEKIIRIEEWPEISLTSREIELNDKYDEMIAEQSISLARNFIAENEGSEEQVERDQMNFLKFLLSNLSIGRNDYILSYEIIENLEVFSLENMSSHYLRNNIVAPLRDKGLLISSTNNGYKLPTSEADLIDFAKFSSSTILPMLSRLEKCRNRILTATNNELDIISDDYFIDLKRFLDEKYQRSLP